MKGTIQRILKCVLGTEMTLRVGWNLEIDQNDYAPILLQFLIVSEARNEPIVHLHEVSDMTRSPRIFKPAEAEPDGIILTSGHFDVGATVSAASPFVGICVRVIRGHTAMADNPKTRQARFRDNIMHLTARRFNQGEVPTVGDLLEAIDKDERSGRPDDGRICVDARVFTDFGMRLDGDIIVNDILRSSERAFDMRIRSAQGDLRYRLFGGIGAVATVEHRRRAISAASRRAIEGALGPFPFRKALHR